MTAKKEPVVKKTEIKKDTKHIALELFKDLDGVVYSKGDKYPHAKSNPAQDRVKALATEDNKYNRPFIKEI